MSSDTADCAASRAGFGDKTGKIIERKRPAIIDRRCDRTMDRAAERSTSLLLGQKYVHTIKTEIVTDSKGRILRLSKPYEGRDHGFEIRKTEGLLPAVPILGETKGTFWKKLPLNLQKQGSSPAPLSFCNIVAK